MSFVKDLALWKSAEKIFAKYLLDYPDFISLEIPDGKFKDYDIKLTTKTKEITYEVKSDTLAPRTWNFVIETRFKWEPSGIYASKCDYVVYNVKWERWIQSRAELILRLIETEKRVTKWWDGRQSELYVISCDELPKLFYPVNVNHNEETGQSDNWNSTEVPEWI